MNHGPGGGLLLDADRRRMIDGGGLSAPASFPRADPLPVVLIVLLWWRGTVLRRWSWIGKQTVPLATGLAIPIDVVLMAENARL